MSKPHDKKIGAVLVQGGGIAGVQASLDLANSGFKVYLVERDAAIGGMMARLDKTFPTGDCATCIISPKLVECARNLNIEILTLSELVGLEGEPGHFTATVLRHPRFVDEDKCTGCSECTQVCPVDTPDEFNRRLGTRKSIAKLYPQATPNIFGITKKGHSPCKTACPVHTSAQGYVALIAEGRFAEAYTVAAEPNPFPAVCGRICAHPCESVCARGSVDAPIAIASLKRFACDHGAPTELPAKLPLLYDEKVAIIGGGPAGLSCARDLAGYGYATTVFEALPLAGGMLRVGIPDHRMPPDVLQREIDAICALGVDLRTNQRCGVDFSVDDLLAEEYKAVFLAPGLHTSAPSPVTGDDLDGCLPAVEFLRDLNLGNPAMVGERVVVIGGGDVAFDAARAASRLTTASGKAPQVTIAYRRSREQMPASAEEIEEGLGEELAIEYLVAPVEIIGNDGKVAAIKLQRCRLGEPDAQGRARPVPIEGSFLEIACETVIFAIGQALVADFAQGCEGIQIERNEITIDKQSLATHRAGVFAGGDVAPSGPLTAIEAIAAGRKAAASIHNYLRGESLISLWENALPEYRPSEAELAAEPKQERIEMPEWPGEERRRSWVEVRQGYTREQAIAEAQRCLQCAVCSECMECVETCEQNAIDHAMREKTITLEVGAVVLTPGFEEFDATRKGEFGYGRYSNVVTSVQFERMLSASGPFEGHVVRLSDGREAKRIAWIQCVGSRDATCDNEYCSSVCCMMATKQALIAGDHVDDMDATIFFIDIRAHGKDFDHYYERARAKDNIHYIKSMPSRVIQLPGSQDLRIAYFDEDGRLAHREFDLVVLSVGMEPPHNMAELATQLNLKLNEFGFCKTDRLQPLSTSRPGVFVGGAAQEPKDIPETVTQASGAASMAMELLAPARNSLVTAKSYPIEHDVTDEAPRLGVFVCHCGMNIASVVDVERVVRQVEHEPDVVLATHTMFTCSDTSLSEMKDTIREHRLNRIVVASCTPRTHEPLFRETLREAGLNPYLFELTNIRDQCSWVHSSEPEAATEKAIDLVKMSIGRARQLRPLEGGTLKVDQTGIVIGGGLSGMTAALALANQGFVVHLIEQANRLGGNLHDIHRTLEHGSIGAFAANLMERVQGHAQITTHLRTDVAGVKGHIGKFHVTLAEGGNQVEVTGGAIIVATGARAATTNEFLCGQSNRVITQVELEKRLHENAWRARGQNIVMIQCVGSRNDEHPYCSRVCCAMAVKNALAVKRLDPTANIYVLYRDVRTYGFRETYYQQAREAGVVFIRYAPEAPPQVTESNRLVVTLESPDLPEPITIEADSVVLSTGIAVDSKNNQRMSDMLKVPLNADGFYVEAHVKLRPVDFTTEGIFLCGLAHSPKFIDENIAQARAAAARASTVLSKTQLDVSAQVSYIDQQKCISCMTCVTVCPYSAPYCNKDGKGQIEAAKCMGCGICAAECPACAIQLHHFETDQFMVMIKALLSGNLAGMDEDNGAPSCTPVSDRLEVEA